MQRDSGATPPFVTLRRDEAGFPCRDPSSPYGLRRGKRAAVGYPHVDTWGEFLVAPPRSSVFAWRYAPLLRRDKAGCEYSAPFGRVPT